MDILWKLYILGQVLGVQQCVITSARHNKWCANNAL